MPLQNRVTPTGEIVAQPWRGALMGHRGILHDADARLGTARRRHNHRVCRVTDFRCRPRAPTPPPGLPNPLRQSGSLNNSSGTLPNSSEISSGVIGLCVPSAGIMSVTAFP